jgi:hypothetical protein
VIEPSTRLFGLVTSDPRVEGHVARLYNALFGLNQLDAAYLTFLLRPEVLLRTLEGFKATAPCEVLDIAPVHQAAVGRWLALQAPVERLTLAKGQAEPGLLNGAGDHWLDPEAVLARATADLRAWFELEARVPDDWRAVLSETTFRPCQLTSASREVHHG